MFKIVLKITGYYLRMNNISFILDNQCLILILVFDSLTIMYILLFRTSNNFRLGYGY